MTVATRPSNILSSVLTALVAVGLFGLSVAPGFAVDDVPGSPGSGTGPRAESIILFIGDGMGIGMLTIGLIYSEMELGRELNMVRLANAGSTGLATTQAADKLVTDSAASGTAIACGRKTNNGRVGTLPEGERAENIFEIAVSHGKSVGVVTSTSVTHATPACFLAHHKYRSYEWDIAQQIVESDAVVVLGGGSKYFLPPERGGGRRGGDLTLVAEEKGFEVVFDRQAVLASEAGRLMGLFGQENTPFERERDAETVPSLAEMTAKAIEILSRNERGFMLMVEGGRIDHAEHENDIDDALMDLLAFDEAIGSAMEFQQANPGVVVIVTADHETGGPAITAAEGGYGGYPNIDQYHTLDDEASPIVSWVSGDHTASMVPIFAVGPGHERFSGIIDNTDIFHAMVDILGFEQ
jgi:alkaline phosphatase